MKYKVSLLKKVMISLTLVGVFCAEAVFLSCFGGPRFEPGDPIGIPPLPPSDAIYGFFAKYKIADDSGDIYRLKDLPIDVWPAAVPSTGNRAYPGEPSILPHNGELLLFFVLNNEDRIKGMTSSVKLAKLRPASPYINAGPNGVAESGLGGDDRQVYSPGVTGLLPSAVVVVDGGNGMLETLPVGDDVVSGLEIHAGANGIAESGTGGNDLQVKLVGTASLAPTDVVIADNGSGVLDTEPAGDDVVDGLTILAGPDGIADSGLGGDDVQKIPVGTSGLENTAVVVYRGNNLTLETNPAGDDMINGNNDITAGPNGIADSGLGGRDVRGVLFKLNDSYYTQTGIPYGEGEPNRLAVHIGADGVLSTACRFNDGFIRDNNNENLIYTSFGDGIYTGIDGIAQSGLAGDDQQFVRAGTPVNPNAILIGPGPDGILQTAPRNQSDDQVVPYGAGVASKDVVVVDAGLDGTLQTCPSGDDYVEMVNGVVTPQIFAGDNLIVDTAVEGDDMYAAFDGGDRIVSSGLGGDDLQLFSAGKTISGVSLPVVWAGADDALQTAVQGDEAEAIYKIQWATGSATPRILDCVVPNAFINPQFCAPASSGVGGDDVQVVSGGDYALATDEVVIAPGTDSVLQTIPRGDDEIVGQTIVAGQNGIAESGVWMDDIQVVRAGFPTLLFLDINPTDGTPETPLLFPVILPGPNGVLDTKDYMDSADDLVLMEYGLDNDPAMELLIIGYFGAGNASYPGTIPDVGLPVSCPPPNDLSPCGPGFLPDGDGLIRSGLGGRGILDAAAGCAAVLDNGESVADIFDPFTGNPPVSQYMPRLPGCPDDFQIHRAGEAVGPWDPIIMAGPNNVFDTNLLMDDKVKMIVDGGNGLAETGLGGDDVQVIPAGRGQPYAMEIIAGPTNAFGGTRVLGTRPSGDDFYTFPSDYPDLAGNGELNYDNPYTVPDPDGDGFVENYATVDDGEYFAWYNTSLINDTLPPYNGKATTGDVVDDVQMVPKGAISSSIPVPCSTSTTTVVDGSGGNGVLETAPGGDDKVDATGTLILCGDNTKAESLVDRRGILSFQVMENPANTNELIGYISNGRGIYMTRSGDGGFGWNAPQLSLSPGGFGLWSDPVILSGMDGICETPKSGDDIQGIPLGQGLPNTPAIWAGTNNMINSVAQGDDYQSGTIIYTGANGIRETPILGDDKELIPLGKGQADSPCVMAGINGHRDTPNGNIGSYDCSLGPAGILVRSCSSDGAAVGDDRPPFIDRNSYTLLNNRDSAYFYNCNPATNQTYGAECPWLPEKNELKIGDADWSGFDALGVKEPYVFAFQGMYYMFYTATGALTEPPGARPSAIAFDSFGPCKRAGLNGAANGKGAADVINADNDASVVVGDRIGMATSTDGINWTKSLYPVIGLSNVCGSALDLSLLGDLAGLPVGIMPGESDFDYVGASRPFVAVTYNADGSPLFAMIYQGLAEKYTAPLGQTGEAFAGFKKGIGLARSFDGVNWVKMDDNNPVFSSDLLGSLLGGGGTTEEGPPSLMGIPDGYVMFFGGREFTLDNNNRLQDETLYIAVAKRYGAVYGACLSVARTTFSSPQNAGAAALLILLIFSPAVFILGRRIYLKRRRKA